MSRLWYAEPAIEWEEALPIGNGRIGGMVYGGIDRELIQVNEESMWYGGKMNRTNPDTKEYLPQIRALIENGEIKKAEHLMEVAMSGCPEGMRIYQTLGEIELFFDTLDIARERQSGGVGKLEKLEGALDYKRELDLETAVATTIFKSGETTYTRRVFASHPADAIIMEIEADGPDKINLDARLRRGKAFDGVKKTCDHGIKLYGNLGRGGFEYAMELRGKTDEGEIKVIGETLEILNASKVTLFFTADTTYQHPLENDEKYENEEIYQNRMQEHLANELNKKFALIYDKDVKTLLKEHIEDHQSLFNRFKFELEGTEKFDILPTNKRLEEAKNGKVDAGLSKILFDYGRYLVIAGSRKEGLPTTLQGLWNKDFFAPWDSKYTININTEMNYWPVESCNLSECHEPLFNLLDKVRVNGRDTARKMYGCRGFVAHHNTDIYGDTAPQDIWYPGTYWTMGGAWLSTHLWKHYLYTKDKKFLEKAFGVLVEASLFFVDFLIEKDGYLVTNPSVSPENSYILPNGEKGAICIGSTMDNQIMRDLFTATLEAFKELEEKIPDTCVIPDAPDVLEIIKKIEYCNSKLMPNRISNSGRTMEWMEDYPEPEPGHRHISHLYGLYPAYQITVDGTPELAKAARKTLEYRLSHGGGHTGWSRAWIMNHYATLMDGELAYENIEKMLGLSTYPNMFDRHPPFQIDGNFGAAAAMSGMLAQSRTDKLILLPALPKKWATGKVTGLRVIGNASLSMEWKDMELVSVTIKAYSDYDACVTYKNKDIMVHLKAGEESHFF